MMGALLFTRLAAMRTYGSRISLRPGILHLCAACVALALFSAVALHAQKGSLAFWEPPGSADASLTHAPRHDSDRYAALRKAFAGFNCTADLMQEQTAGTHGDKNLVCTLPGQTPATILVAARYDGRAGAGFQPTWVDAIALPLLDHALQAQPRHHTFIFAALIGEDGENAFFSALRSSGKPLPSAMFVLDGLGWGPPLWYTMATVKATPGHAAEFGVNGLLGGIASGIGHIVKVPDPVPLSPEHFRTNSGFASAEYYRSQRYESTLFRNAGTIPELLLYSDQPEAATIESHDLDSADIRRDFDYTAWILCLADLRLDAAPVPANPGSGPGKGFP
jgi:hypothetical protein